VAQAATGERAQALATLDEARALAGLRPDRFTECELHKTEGVIHYYGRDHASSIAAAERALTLGREYGFHYEAAVNAHNIAEAHLRLGDYKRAFAFLRYSYELAREHGFTKVEMLNVRVLGFIDAIRFRSEEGRERIRRAVEYAEEHGYVWDTIQAKYMLAVADYAHGRVESAREGFRDVLRTAAGVGNRRFEEDAEAALRALDAGLPVPLPN
jgi:tetratricopeptide (TPR) repeat protein